MKTKELIDEIEKLFSQPIGMQQCQHLNSTKQNEKSPKVLYNHQEEDLIMSRQKSHHTKQFKLDAVNYRKEHPDLTQVECAKNLGIGVSTLARWEAQFRDNDGDIPVIGSGNYASEEEREIARLRRELRDAQDALDVLKKAISILGKD